MLAHLSQFSLLTTRQHGFLHRRLTLTNLLVAEELITKWLGEGSANYLDFSKAFDSVSHRLLLRKLRGYGIAPIVISWVECFLSRRTFQVNVNAVLLETILCGPNPRYSPPVQNLYPITPGICYSSNPFHPMPRRQGTGKGAKARFKVCERASACPV